MEFMAPFGPAGIQPSSLKSILDCTNDALFLTEEDPRNPPAQRICFVNEAFTRLTGYAPEEAAGRPPTFLCTASNDPILLRQVRAAFERGAKATFLLLKARKDGSRFRAELTVNPVAAEAGTRHVAVGRPNVGKSSILNALLGEERSLVHDAPGTTTDPVDTPFSFGGRDYVLVDTAGIRRRARVTEHIEKISVVKALQAIEQADVVIALVDAQDEIGVHDARLLGLVAERGRGLVLAVNKWDGLESAARARVREAVDFKLPFLDFMPVHTISALHGSGLAELMKDVQAVHAASTRELKTPELTRVLEKAVFDHAPPAVIGRRIKLRYAHLGGRMPLTIIVHGNQTDRLPDSYRRYLANEFRRAFELKGLPLRVEFKTGDNPFKGKRNVLTPRQRKKQLRVRGRR